MNDAARNGVPLTEDQARRIICTNLAEVLQRGSCTVRIRRLRDEGRVTFQAQHNNRWQPLANMDYSGTAAEGVMHALLAVGPKRNRDVHVSVQNSGNHDDVTIGFHHDAAAGHRTSLYQYVYGQLFWD